MKVLLIGDSIRMFYQNEVVSQLGDGYEVYAPEENCRFSLYILNSLRFWLNDFPTPDIIHFNAGLWDTAILYHEDGCFLDVESYVKYMKMILRELKKTGAKIHPPDAFSLDEISLFSLLFEQLLLCRRSNRSSCKRGVLPCIRGNEGILRGLPPLLCSLRISCSFCSWIVYS